MHKLSTNANGVYATKRSSSCQTTTTTAPQLFRQQPIRVVCICRQKVKKKFKTNNISLRQRETLGKQHLQYAIAALLLSDIKSFLHANTTPSRLSHSTVLCYTQPFPLSAALCHLTCHDIRPAAAAYVTFRLHKPVLWLHAYGVLLHNNAVQCGRFLVGGEGVP